MKEINEHLESTPPRWDADLGRWIEPEEFLENEETVSEVTEPRIKMKSQVQRLAEACKLVAESIRLNEYAREKARQAALEAFTNWRSHNE